MPGLYATPGNKAKWRCWGMRVLDIRKRGKRSGEVETNNYQRVGSRVHRI